MRYLQDHKTGMTLRFTMCVLNDKHILWQARICQGLAQSKTHATQSKMLFDLDDLQDIKTGITLRFDTMCVLKKFLGQIVNIRKCCLLLRHGIIGTPIPSLFTWPLKDVHFYLPTKDRKGGHLNSILLQNCLDLFEVYNLRGRPYSTQFLAFFDPPPPCTQHDSIVTKQGYLLYTLLRKRLSLPRCVRTIWTAPRGSRV